MSEFVKPLLEIKMANMASVIEELLSMGKEVRMTVTGSSMYPFLRDGKDSVILSPPVSQYLQRGDIVLFVRANGQYVLHRIFKMRGRTFFMLGDAQTQVEGPLDAQSVVAVVGSVYRGAREIKADGFSWRTLSLIWMMFRPVRPLLIRLGNRICRYRMQKNHEI
jgi:signal peptidase